MEVKAPPKCLTSGVTYQMKNSMLGQFDAFFLSCELYSLMTACIANNLECEGVGCFWVRVWEGLCCELDFACEQTLKGASVSCGVVPCRVAPMICKFSMDCMSKFVYAVFGAN